MSANPFASPSEAASYTIPPPNSEDGYVKQILFVGIFMIIEGVLEVLFFVLMAAYAVILPVMMATDPQFKEAMNKANEGPGGLRPEQFFFWIAIGMGAGPLLAGICRIVGGIFAIRRKNRGMVIAANIVGLLSIISCYCIITGIPTTVYSLVILFQGSVAQAFEAERLRSQRNPNGK